MEKLEKQWLEFSKTQEDQVPDFSEVDEINELLKNKKENKEEIKQLYLKIIEQTKIWINLARTIPQILDHIFDYINEVSKKLSTKKLYKFPYDTSYKDFSELDTYSKIRQLLINKYKNDLSEINYNWWNCHNWTLLYYDFLKELKPKILTFDRYSAHSILVLNFWENVYIADSNMQEKFNIKKANLWDKLDIWNHYIATIINLKPLEFNITKWNQDIENNYKWKIYNNDLEFINYLDNKKPNYFLLEYNHIWENNEKILYSFYVHLNEDKIDISIKWILWEKEKIFSLRKTKFKKWKKELKTNKDIIYYIIERTWKKLNEEQKQIIDWIITKIPEWYIKYLVNLTKKDLKN